MFLFPRTRLISMFAQAVLIASLGVRAAVAAEVPKASELRLLTFNVLFDGERKFDPRKDREAEVVKGVQADFIGLQETSPKQLAFFQSQLPEFGTVGPVPLTPQDVDSIAKTIPFFKALGITTYTDVILLYRKNRFEKLEDGNWWLSPTGDKVSVGFGNSMPRVMVWARFKDLQSKQEIVVAVTHFDNTLPSQTKMAALAHQKLQGFIDKKLPVIFMGDFNTDQSRGDYPMLTSGGWRDSYLASPKASKTGVDSNVSTSDNERIDHIFYHGNALKAIEWHRVERPDSEELSDHYPVFARLDWK